MRACIFGIKNYFWRKSPGRMREAEPSIPGRGVSERNFFFAAPADFFLKVVLGKSGRNQRLRHEPINICTERIC